ncbi:hypothetical protein HDU81_008144 [Chytriomyces hyalinus]|nr:hypothetical protein HDU81_008144 [Chytriomyces hyalinus]
MDPLTSLDAFESSAEDATVQPASHLGSITRSAALESMPPEILDRIVEHVDADSLLQLCHSMPYYKYISTAMFDFARRFPSEDYTVVQLWPDMHFPPKNESRTTEFPIQHLHAADVYSRIVLKHGGNIHIPCSKNLFNYLGAIPDELSIFPGDIQTFGFVRENDGWADVAHQLTRLPVQSLIWENELTLAMQEALPRIPGLEYLQVDYLADFDEKNSLSQCLDLKELSFSDLRGLEDTEDLQGHEGAGYNDFGLSQTWLAQGN